MTMHSRTGDEDRSVPEQRAHLAVPGALQNTEPNEPAPMVLTIDAIKAYDRNPRRERNEAYDLIRQSIRQRGPRFASDHAPPGRSPVHGSGRRQHGVADRFARGYSLRWKAGPLPRDPPASHPTVDHHGTSSRRTLSRASDSGLMRSSSTPESLLSLVREVPFGLEDAALSPNHTPRSSKP